MERRFTFAIDARTTRKGKILKIEIELASEQMTKLLDAIVATYEDLDNKIKHLKGRVNTLERLLRESIK